VFGFAGSQLMSHSGNLSGGIAGIQRQLSGAAQTAPVVPAAGGAAPQAQANPNPNSGAPLGRRGNGAPGANAAPGANTQPGGNTAPAANAAPGANTRPGRNTAPGANAAPGGNTAPGGNSAPGANAAPPANAAPASNDPSAPAIQQAIQSIDAAQAQAVSSNDVSGLTAGATTTDFATQQQNDTQDLLDNGVTDIQLVTIEWGPISVNGATATATAYETWRTTYSDGTTDQSRDRNVYTLVQQDGTWKVQADEHPDSLAGAFPGGLQSIPGIPKNLLPPGLQTPFGNP
jgi:hypothetical protein